MALEGTIKDFPVTDIFQLIDMQNKTGSLALEAEHQLVRVFFSEGKVIWAEDNLRDPEARLGVILTNTGKLDKERLEEALARQKGKKERLGSILLHMGCVTEGELEEALERQVSETAFQVFRWKEGRYRFTAQRSLEIQERLVKPLAVENLLLEAMRILDEWPLIEKELPSLDSLLFRAPRGPRGVEAEKLTEEERWILDLVDGVKSLRGVIEASALGELDTCKILAGFLRSGVLEAKAKPSEEQEAEVFPLPGAKLRPEGPWILLSAVALLLMVLNLFLLHSDPANLIPFYPSGGKSVASAKVYWAKSEIKGWEEALRRFYGEWGYWPRSLKELKTKEGGIVLGDKDAWGNGYQYRVEETGFHISSFGEDGIEGTEDDIRGGEA